MAGFLIALCSGALMSIQGVFNTQVTKASSVWVANVFVQLTALFVVLAIWIGRDRTSFLTLLSVEPKYMLLGGVMGAGITYTVIKSVSALGPGKSALLIVTSQVAVSYLIELFGLFGMDKQPFTLRRLIGFVVAVAGIIILKI
ncbi:MAG: DMT family transporter [Lachnospiraceae bacterium]|nr:DMT family transporter [Lachnospiraceae bacterium]